MRVEYYEKEEKLHEILTNYYYLSPAQQMENVIETAFEVGSFRKILSRKPVEI